jgi:nucleoside phosphorylase
LEILLWQQRVNSLFLNTARSEVIASSAFVAEVKKIDRKFIAIDMEAARVAPVGMPD